jgi:hypothetical protein
MAQLVDRFLDSALLEQGLVRLLSVELLSQAWQGDKGCGPAQARLTEDEVKLRDEKV